jgi:hypothetical protein
VKDITPRAKQNKLKKHYEAVLLSSASHPALKLTLFSGLNYQLLTNKLSGIPKHAAAFFHKPHPLLKDPAKLSVWFQPVFYTQGANNRAS